MSARGVLRIIESGQLGFWCPGCKEIHVVNSGWAFNGNYDKPTFSPSVLVTSGHYSPNFKSGDDCWCTYWKKHPEEQPVFQCERCHSFVNDGQIQFLSDCTHSLVGQTVALGADPNA